MHGHAASLVRDLDRIPSGLQTRVPLNTTTNQPSDVVLRSQTAGACRYPGEMSEEPHSYTIWDQEWEPALEDPHSRSLRELLEPQGCSKVVQVDYSEGGSHPATMELAARAACRTITSADDVTRLCREGADADVAIEVHLASRRVPPVGLLSLVIIDAIVVRNTDTRLTLPPWPSRELQQAVLEALIDAGANANFRPGEGFRPLPAARSCANVTAVDALLRAGAVTQGMYLAFLPNQPYLPFPPSFQYEAALLKAYRRVLQQDPTLASEEYRDGKQTMTPIHMSGSAEGFMSAEFLRSYLTLLAEHGASITARTGDRYTPLGSAVHAGAPCVVEWLCQRLGREEINKRQHTNAEGISLLEYAGFVLSLLLRDKAAPEAVDRARQVIGTLLRHGADIQLIRTTTPRRRYVRKLVQDIHKEMNQPSAPPQQQQQQQQESGAAKAAKIAARLIGEEVKDKAKKAKRGGKKDGKGGGHPQQHEQQQHGQQQSVSIESEAIDDEEPSSVSTGVVDTDADEQPPSASSADPQPAAPSPSCDVSSAVPAPATSPVDREDSDGEFVPVVRGRKKPNKKARPDQQEPALTLQHAPVTQTQPLSISGRPFSSSAARRPAAGRGLVTHVPTQTRSHRGPPPLVLMAAMPPSIGSSALPPRPQHPPPHALVRPLAASERQGADRPAASPSTIDTNTAFAQRTSVSAGSSSHTADGQRGRCGGGEGEVGTDSAAAAEHLVGQLRRQLSHKDQENDALIRQLQEVQWKFVQSSHHLQQQQQQQQAGVDTPPAAPTAAADDGLKCDVCMDNYKSTLLVPCRHICLCGGCAGVLMSGPPAERLCPRCRQPITDTQQVYL
ncbi:unnamed protein product [Vitrella brassicaformis CCMP3155]|uniref:RING-type domain-containing protein n=2 Tax=Vitrella brassicaformis TaxID=1169539 RepID=A0A0G4FTT9_VITBC|nr:unnamed protein product [Vitrella brassicaformis CCMP3155]|eukprot:CEM18309.1 unnamed protein product [Vitrella brassicaformis CCMP3155]